MRIRMSVMGLLLASSLTACLEEGTGPGGGGAGGGGPPLDEEETSDPTGKLDADELSLGDDVPDEPTCGTNRRAGDGTCLP